MRLKKAWSRAFKDTRKKYGGKHRELPRVEYVGQEPSRALEWAAESAEREEREIWGRIEVLYDGSLVFPDQTTHYERSFHFGG